MRWKPLLGGSRVLKRVDQERPGIRCAVNLNDVCNWFTRKLVMQLSGEGVELKESIQPLERRKCRHKCLGFVVDGWVSQIDWYDW